MATLALSVAGAAAGSALLPGGFSLLGATFGGAAIGRALGGLAGAYIDNALFGASGQTTVREGPRLSDLTVTTSSEGTAIPRLYGRARLGGQIIWATNFEEEVSTTNSDGGKGVRGASASQSTTYCYYANFAVGLCEGVVTRLGRVWADGQEINLADYSWRLYTGTETQLPDAFIEARHGSGTTPAYRGLAYIVFERLPLAEFGNRIPQLNFEVFRAVDAFEASVQGVTMIPSAGEFAYHPAEVRVDDGAGTSYAENRHTNLGVSDFSVAVDQLEQSLPNAKAVSLFVAWFGSDLRCGNCVIEPRVDARDKVTTPVEWRVAGLTRATAKTVSTHDTRPAYGGTPSDVSVIAAIRDLNTRDLDVLYTPFLLMDVPQDNALLDPYTGAPLQAAYPWRGRITCSPAPGTSGSPDRSMAVRAQIDAFIGMARPENFTIVDGTVIYNGPDEWSYRRFVLHAAMLCKAAGGVAAFVIGSELRGLTTLRDSANTYPFVDALISIASDVAIILPDAQLTYAADWSEYFGHRPSDNTGDVFFHLDPLWSDVNIDAVAIDCYWPLSDWRDGTDHLDYKERTRFIHDLDYLKRNIEGGEGFDWYYASVADRIAQRRTAITDAHSRPWVFRFKDIRSWWQNAHYNRPGGTEDGTPTAWTPEGKPIWFTELGCPACDKGSNQPNVFFDPKSTESAVPYFSRGTRDDLIQRRYARAFLEWYNPEHTDFAETQNPVSSVYAGRMVDNARIMLYTWDARPHPAFPALQSIWPDGDNWALGHWLTGRAAEAPLAETVGAILTDYGFDAFNADALSGMMAGYVIDNVMAARNALQPLETAFFFDSFESEGRLQFRHRAHSETGIRLTPDDLVETKADAALYALTRVQETDLPRSAQVTYIDGDRDYAQGTAEGRRIAGTSGRISQARLPIVTSYERARGVAETLVQEAWAARERAYLSLPPSMLALDASDVVALDVGGRTMPLRLTGLSLGEAIECEALSIEPQLYDSNAAPSRTMTAATPAIYGAQSAAFLDLPLIRGDEVAYAGAVAAFGAPWPGGVAFYRSPTESGFDLKAFVRIPATMGVTETAFHSGPTGRWDHGNVLRVKLTGGTLANVEPTLVLGGANIAAIEAGEGEWEVFQFATAKLVAPLTYDLSKLLRGQFGTEGAMRSPLAPGARFVFLDEAVEQVDMTPADVGLAATWKYGPSRYGIGNPAYVTRGDFAFHGIGLRPLSPCHILGDVTVDGDLKITWIRRTRQGGDNWEQLEVPLAEDVERYEVDVLKGASVVRTLTATAPNATYALADQITDFGAPQSSYAVRVHQISASYGRGAPREATLP